MAVGCLRDVGAELGCGDLDKGAAEEVLDFAFGDRARAGVCGSEDVLVAEGVDQDFLFGGLVACVVGVEQGGDFEVVGVEDGGEVDDLAGAARWQEGDLPAEVGDPGVAQQLGRGFQIPEVGEPFEDEIAVVDKQGLGEVVAEGLLEG